MVLESNGRETMVTDDLCPPGSKPRHERECVMTESRGCRTEWEEGDWGEVSMLLVRKFKHFIADGYPLQYWEIYRAKI